MRKLIALLFISTCLAAQIRIPGPGGISPFSGFTITAGGTAEASGSVTDIVSSPFSAPTGSTVACVVSWNGGNPSATAIDSQGNTYSAGTAATVVNFTQLLYFIGIPVGSGSLTVDSFVNFTTNIAGISCFVITGGVTGVESGSNLPSNGGNGNSQTTAALTTTTSSTAIIVGCGVDRAGSTSITTSGYALIETSGANNVATAAKKVTLTTVIAETTDWLFTNGPWHSCATIAFK